MSTNEGRRPRYGNYIHPVFGERRERRSGKGSYPYGVRKGEKSLPKIPKGSKCKNCGKPFEPKGEQNVCSIECFVLLSNPEPNKKGRAEYFRKVRESEGYMEEHTPPEASEPIYPSDILHVYAEAYHEGLHTRLGGGFWEWRGIIGPIEEDTLAEEIYV